jgi:hypothetical protein
LLRARTAQPTLVVNLGSCAQRYDDVYLSDGRTST